MLIAVSSQGKGERGKGGGEGEKGRR